MIHDKKLVGACVFSGLYLLTSSAGTDDVTGRVMLANDYYVVVQTDPSYLDRYTGARLYSFLPAGLREGTRVSGIESTWGRQTWIVGGQEISVGVDEYDMTADEAIEYFSKHSR